MSDLGARRRRRSERGHAVVVLALGGVTLLALVGLAIDGGMTAGAFRHAQNAADAGALAAARQELINALSFPPQASDAATLSDVAGKEVSHNNASMLGAGAPTAMDWDAGGGDGISQSYQLAGRKLGWLFTGSQTTYVPNTATGLEATAAYADVTTTAGLPPAKSHLELVGVHSTANMRLPGNGGSIATSLVDVGEGDAGGTTGYESCAMATAQYSPGSSVAGAPVSCPAGAMPLGVDAEGTVEQSVPDARVGSDNHPSAAPSLEAGLVVGHDGVIPVAAAEAYSHNQLTWDPLKGLTSRSSTYATGVTASWGTLSLSAQAISMSASVSVNSVGQTSATFTCAPVTLSFADSVSHVTTTISVTSSCSAPGLGLAGVSVPYVQPPTASACSTDSTTGVVTCGLQTCFLRATVPTAPYPTTLCIGENNVVLSATPVTIGSSSGSGSGGGTDCSGSASSSSSSSSTSTSSSGTASTSSTTSTSTTLTGSGTTSCSTTTSSTSTASSGSTSSTDTSTSTTSSSSSSSSDTGGGTGTPTTTSPWLTQFTGTVTVSAQVDQPTYFLGVLGWTHTTPSATASADQESVIVVTGAAFANSPFAMPDTALDMQAPFTSEHLTPGHTYYLYGPAMQTDSRSPAMPATWQGQLAPASPHRVGATVVGSATTTTAPQPYLSNGPYWLVPIFDPATGMVENYGVFIPVAGHANWGTLVNSIQSFSGQPTLHGYVVQATSQSGWITFEEGAVSVKLLQ